MSAWPKASLVDKCIIDAPASNGIFDMDVDLVTDRSVCPYHLLLHLDRSVLPCRISFKVLQMLAHINLCKVPSMQGTC